MADAVAAVGVEPKIKILDADAKTAVAAAEQLGCEVGAIPTVWSSSVTVSRCW